MKIKQSRTSALVNCLKVAVFLLSKAGILIILCRHSVKQGICNILSDLA